MSREFNLNIESNNKILFNQKALEEEIGYFDPDKILLINLALSSIL